MAWRVCSVSSNLTGRPVFFCRTVARSAVYPLAAISSTLIATTSQPRSLLSIAKLNMARSRARPSIWSLVRIDQTCLGRSGGFAPVTLPLFQGTRLWGVGVAFTWSCMAILLGYRGEQHVPRALESGQLSGHCGLRIWLNGERPVAIDSYRTFDRDSKKAHCDA